MGFAGTGTVVNFSTLWHTMYVPILQYHGYFTGILQQGVYNFIVLKVVFSHIESLFLHCVMV